VAEEVATLDLRALDLAPGAAGRLRLRVPPVELRSGGSDYVTEPAAPEVDVEAVRSLSGLHLRLRAAIELRGPCWRCLGDARVSLPIDVSEFQAEGREGADFDEDLDSAYVDGDRVDLALWVRDSIAEALPPTILCRDDCAGLCPICGGDRNAAPCDCAVEETDPRWDALREIAERLGRGET
jgi:uncharacterized protein